MRAIAILRAEPRLLARSICALLQFLGRNPPLIALNLHVIAISREESALELAQFERYYDFQRGIRPGERPICAILRF